MSAAVRRCAAGVLALALATGCTPTLYVDSACDTFAPESMPRAATRLRKGPGGLELLVPFVQGATDDGDAVFAAAKRQPVDVVIYPSERYAHVARVEGDVLVIDALSAEHAASVAELMCVDPIAATPR